MKCDKCGAEVDKITGYTEFGGEICCILCFVGGRSDLKKVMTAIERASKDPDVTVGTELVVDSTMQSKDEHK